MPPVPPPASPEQRRRKDAADPTLFVGIYTNTATPVSLACGGTHASDVQQGEIVNDLRTAGKDKLPGVTFSEGGSCDQQPHELDFDATFAVSDSGDINELRHGGKIVAVHVLAYDIDIHIVACYEAQTASIASVKHRKFPLPEGSTEQSDAGSAHNVGMQEMDRHAQAFVEGTIAAALGF